VESVNGVRLHYPPGAFGQSNLPLADRLARRVGELVPDGARVLELYAGVGALGLPLAERAARLALNEHTPDSLRGLAAGVAELSEEVRGRVAIHAGPAQSQSGALAEADHVIADPPRRGLDAGVIEALVQTPVARLIYVSCGLDSFLAQARALLDSGRYELEGLEAFVMVPYTEHIETLAWFRGKPAAPSAPT
jgi:tRNA/tmRNA/rRNA uracil-C5-methylase (TrmA/RlmC/RlmD family)